MLFLESIPADVWITIFEYIEEPAQLAQVLLVCTKFRQLATKILLKYLIWAREKPTRRNLRDWETIHHDLLCLPRRLKLSIAFENFLFTNNPPVSNIPSSNMLYSSIIQQLSNFTMLEELILYRTSVTPIIYQLIALLPKLRLLECTGCTFIGQDPFGINALPEVEQRSALTHLVLQNNNPSREQPTMESGSHPLHQLAAQSLRSLTITWAPTSSLLFATQHWRLPNLTELNLHIALLTRDLMDSAVEFVNHCSARPLVSLRVIKHNVPDNQISSISVPMPGLRSFRGPLPVVGMFAGSTSQIEHVTVTEALEINQLLSGLERLSKNIRTLDLQLRKYDNEVLFAIRQLFPNIESVQVRFGKGGLPENIMVMLGSDILPDLKQLRTLRLSMDVNCVPPQPSIDYNAFFLLQTINSAGATTEDDGPAGPGDAVSTAFDPADLKDYLVGWNRYCPKLRTVQLTSVSIWSRRFEGDPWVEKPCELSAGNKTSVTRQGHRNNPDTFSV